MRRETVGWLLAVLSLQHVHGHGRLEDPPARNAAWRYGFNVPANYDDVGLNCGGLSIQKANEGKCGVCGDAYSGPRDHEIGGKYATNTIVRNYISGAQIAVKILLTANHVGFMELRLCPLSDATTELTQECLDQNLLFIEGFGTQYPVNEGIDTIFLKAHLPHGLSCTHCVLQWRYHAGNSWGTDDVTGNSCLGCGYQEEFYNCADISIAADENYLPPMPTTSSTEEPLLVYPVFPPSELDSPVVSTTEPPALMNPIYPYQSEEQLLGTMHANNKTLRCFPTHEVLKPLVGIEDWCLQLCAEHCPPTLCVCVQL